MCDSHPGLLKTFLTASTVTFETAAATLLRVEMLSKKAFLAAAISSAAYLM